MYKYKNSVFFKIIIPFSVFLFFSAQAQATTLSISGNKFTIDGQAKFLVLASYFDGMDAPNVGADLDYLKSKGINGVRVFPNWWERLNPLTSGNTLMDESGNLGSSRLNDLKRIIETANSKGMIVDVSFARETVSGPCEAQDNNGVTYQVMCMTEYKRGIATAANALKNYGNIFFDIQNEASGENKITFMPLSDIRDAGNKIRTTGSASPISASYGVTYGSSASGLGDLDIISWHIPGGNNFGTYRNSLSGLGNSSKPTYVGEPYNTGFIDDEGATTQDLVSRVVEAKKAGLSAWTFHSSGNFNLDGRSLLSTYSNVEKEFLNSYKSVLDSTIWGIGTVNPPTGSACINTAPDPSVVPDMSSVVNAVANENPNWVLEACDNYNFIDEVVRRLRAGQGGTKWAYEAKRANPNDPWKEGVSYYYGTGNAPVAGSMSSYEVFAVDVLRQGCPNNPSINAPYWGVADWPNNPPGVFNVAYMYPKTTSGGSLPTPVMCSGGVPTTDPPTITNIDPTSAVPGQSVEVYGTNLSNDIQLIDNSGTIINVEGSPNNELTITTFMVPLNITPGIYNVAVTNSIGYATSTQNLTVQVGGQPFPTSVSPTIPTQGLPTDLGQLIQQIFTWSLYILGISVFVMFFYSGFLWLTAAGNTSRVGEAKTHMTNAVFGAILLLSSYLILYTINPDFVQNTFNLPGLGTTTSPAPISNSGSPSLLSPPNNASAQIRALNSILNEYNTYNNAAKQMNTSNNPL